MKTHETQHLRSILRYFPHDPSRHPPETDWGEDSYVLGFEKCLDDNQRRYHAIRCHKCEKRVELPSGYDWEAAWRVLEPVHLDLGSAGSR